MAKEEITNLELLGYALQDTRYYEEAADNCRLTQGYAQWRNLRLAVGTLINFRIMTLPSHYQVIIEEVIDPKIKQLRSKLESISTGGEQR